MLSPILFALASASSQSSDPCPMRIDVTNAGDFFTNRFYGHYKTSPKLLDRDLKGGCYNDNDPRAVSSVTVRIESGAPDARVALLYRILEQNGWPKPKIKVVP